MTRWRLGDNGAAETGSYGNKELKRLFFFLYWLPFSAWELRVWFWIKYLGNGHCMGEESNRFGPPEKWTGHLTPGNFPLPAPSDVFHNIFCLVQCRLSIFCCCFPRFTGGHCGLWSWIWFPVDTRSFRLTEKSEYSGVCCLFSADHRRPVNVLLLTVWLGTLFEVLISSN